MIQNSNVELYRLKNKCSKVKACKIVPNILNRKEIVL